MNLNTLLTRGNEYVYSDVAGEVVMMNITTGNYASFNETGNVVWYILDRAKTVQIIIDELALAHKVTPEQCQTDLLPFLEKLVDRKILVEAA